jgi:hypothetical protein
VKIQTMVVRFMAIPSVGFGTVPVDAPAAAGASADTVN